MTKIKICGLMSAKDAEYANEAKPDWAGMILAPRRRRTVSCETAKEIRQKLDRSIPLVGVFVNADITEIAELAENHIIQYVQLHGQETAEYIRELRVLCKLPIIQAFSIRCAEDLQAAEQSPADIILLDNGNGGTDQCFDHTLLSGFSRPYLLAGGITPENSAEIIANCHPYGLDTSSGVETDGRKDPEKMRKIVMAVREAGKL